MMKALTTASCIVCILLFFSLAPASALKISPKRSSAASAIIIASFILNNAAVCNADTVTVLGGNGFVGSRVVQELVLHGDKVISVSKSGLRPSDNVVTKTVADKVKWLKGDPSTTDLQGVFRESDAVVSCIGAIGFDEEVLRNVNGNVNVAAVRQAKDAGVKRFIYVSVSSLVPEALGGVLPAYFEGKTTAEDAVKSLFGANGVLIKPSFIYVSMRNKKLCNTLINPYLIYAGRGFFYPNTSACPWRIWVVYRGSPIISSSSNAR
jgi:nucleoside-diphosphate-sugar epimerase